MSVPNMRSNQADQDRSDSAAGSHDLVVRSSREFATLFQPNTPHGGLFYPTRRKLPVGAVAVVRVRLGRRQPPMVLYGTVAWRRPGRHLEKIRAGIGVEFLASEQSKVHYLLNLSRAGDTAKSRRRHERISVDLPVNWRPLGASEGVVGRLCDVGRGGAFVRTDKPVHGDDQVVVEIAPPGAEVPMAFTARVAWTGAAEGGGTGFGIEWRARDAGGSRRIRELVRRLTVVP